MESPQIGLPGHPPEGKAPGVWLASFKQHSAVHGEVWKSATSMGLRAPAGRFDAAKGDDGRRAVSSSPGREPWTAGSSGEMTGDADEGIEVDMLPLVFSSCHSHPAEEPVAARGRRCRGAGGGRVRSRDRRRQVAQAGCQAYSTAQLVQLGIEGTWILDQPEY